MATKGNHGFAELIAGEGARPVTPRLPPRTGVLSGRENRLAELAQGQAVTRVHELVDPARCRIWSEHNRDYAALDASTCSDLIESMTAQGRQEVPAIVRRVTGVPEVEYEVICGARRHWTVTWLRAHGHPTFRFLVEPRELSDEEAFRVSDLENRNRQDLSDYERARDYARAIERYYDGSQQRMAERLRVTTSWLSRYLELAKLPAPVIAAFGSTAAIGISHAAKLAPLLRVPVTRKRLEAEAVVLAEEQERRREAGRKLLAPAQIVAALSEAKRPAKPQSRRAVVRNDAGRIVMMGDRSDTGRLTIMVPAAAAGQGADAILDAMRRLMDELG